MTGEGLVFAGGVPRSGLTLLRAIVSAHPDIACGQDTNFLPTLLSQYRHFAQSLGELYEKDFNLTGKALNVNFARLVTDLYGHALTTQTKKCLVEKSPLNLLVFEDAAKLLPGAKFIHVVRDGRDVVASLLQRDWRSWRDPHTGAPLPYISSPDGAARYWASLTSIAYQAEKKINNPARFLTVHYETLVRQPEITLKTICEFLNVDYRDEMVTFYKNPPLTLSGMERDSEKMLRTRLTKTRINRWKDDLSQDQQFEIHQTTKPILVAFGYS